MLEGAPSTAMVLSHQPLLQRSKRIPNIQLLPITARYVLVGRPNATVSDNRAVIQTRFVVGALENNVYYGTIGGATFPRYHAPAGDPDGDDEEAGHCRIVDLQAKETTALHHRRCHAISQRILDVDCNRSAARFHLRASI